MDDIGLVDIDDTNRKLSDCADLLEIQLLRELVVMVVEPRSVVRVPITLENCLPDIGEQSAPKAELFVVEDNTCNIASVEHVVLICSFFVKIDS